jgi:chromosome segregation ATPase
LRHNILEIKEKLSRIEERKKLLHNIQDHYNLIQKDISGSTKTAAEAIQSRRQLKEIEKGLNSYKTEFNRYQTKRSSLNEDIRVILKFTENSVMILIHCSS